MQMADERQRSLKNLLMKLDIERKCAEQTYALLDLQKQLLGDIHRKRMIEEHNVDVCTSKIEKALSNKPTLVVLDGVDNFEQESPQKPWKRSRIWNHEESLNLLKEDKGTTKIQGLVLDMKMLEKVPLGGISRVVEHEFKDNDPNMSYGIEAKATWLIEDS
ncbi:hypothetical protein L2E82_11295 [Cichorium intybus]|uniref:Uncharacterized protein n=1 Tax=Cichorium intybus TaxID=13427 RepID=A0ACB9GE52_CICIN|nr:hypothetical protein L2E82_11295 [Cichorium intybus]